MAEPKVRLRHTPDELSVGDSTWLNLGQLRALVAKADELGWDDSSLVSYSPGHEHPRRHDVRICRRLVVEGEAGQ